MSDLQFLLCAASYCVLAPLTAIVAGIICQALTDEYHGCRLRQLRHQRHLHPPAFRRLRT